MGTCENEINLGVSISISSDGSHSKDVVHQNQGPEEQDQDDINHDQTQEGEIPITIVEKFESLELQGNDGDGDDEDEDEDDYDDEVKTHNYPLRSDAKDCTFYLKTGTCKFGFNCRFNHPPNRAFQVYGDKEKGIEESNGLVPDAGKIECKYFSTPGGCKYGDACRYNHSRGKIEAKDPELNFLGLPIRPLEKECTFYLRSGTCGYGAKCRFHHPDPTSAKESDGNSLGNGGSLRRDNVNHKNYEPSFTSGVLHGILPQQSNGIDLRNSLPYAASMSPYHHGMLQNPGWNQNQVVMSLPTYKPPLPHQIVNNFSKVTLPPTHYEHLMQSEEFPERPGQANCDYFMRTGDCKYKSACRYNHPSSRTPKIHLPSLSMKGTFPGYATVETTDLSNLRPNHMRKTGVPSADHQQMQNGQFPERPGQPECEYYMKTGNCKFRSVCRYHHPWNRVSSSSTSALNEKGLPLRPGSRICRNYEQQGTCKYGRNCLFHHPDDTATAVQDASVAVPQYDSSTNAAAATDAEKPASNNDASDWDDGWAM